MDNKKRTILIDLDGVLNEYKGCFDPYFIPNIKNGAKEFLTELSESFDIKIFTTRNKMLASKWIMENGLDKIIKDVTNVKELAWIYIDDRCLTFKGNYNELKYSIMSFKPWYVD